MAKNELPAKAAGNEPATLQLTDFCIRLSAKDARVELIGGFEHSERVAGRMVDTAEKFAERYSAFINQPA